jgi:putative MATE family efflux protein
MSMHNFMTPLDALRGAALKQRFQRDAAYVGLFSVLSYAVDYSFQLVDTFWVARIGAGAATALSLTTAIIYVVMALNEIVGVSSVAMLSQADGHETPEAFARLFWSIATLKLALGLLFAAAFVLYINYGLNWLTDASVRDYVSSYSYVIWPSLIIVPIYSTMMTTLRISGRAALSAGLSIGAFLLNFCLVPPLVFGYLGFPALGIGGAAWATIVAQFIVFAAASLAVLRGRYGASICQCSGLKLSKEIMSDLILVGLPVGGVMLIANIEQAAITAIVARHPADVSDGVSVANRLFGFVYMINFGVAAGVSITVGQFVGAGRAGIIQRALRGFAMRAVLLAGLISVALALLASPIVSSFTGTDFSVGAAQTYLWFMVMVSAGNCCFLVYSGVYEGFGKNWPVFRAAFLAHVLMEGPLLLAAMLAEGPRLALVWLIVTFGSLAAAAIIVVMCRRTLSRHSSPQDSTRYLHDDRTGETGA